MSNKKQTAVDWLFDRMVGLAEDYDDGKINYITYINGVNHFLDQAKEMEKQQIIDAYGVKIKQDIEQGQTVYIRTTGEQYYKETYGETN